MNLSRTEQIGGLDRQRYSAPRGGIAMAFLQNVGSDE